VSTVQGITKFLDSESLSPHLTAHIFLGLENMDKFCTRGQNTTGLMCTHCERLSDGGRTEWGIHMHPCTPPLSSENRQHANSTAVSLSVKNDPPRQQQVPYTESFENFVQTGTNFGRGNQLNSYTLGPGIHYFVPELEVWYLISTWSTPLSECISTFIITNGKKNGVIWSVRSLDFSTQSRICFFCILKEIPFRKPNSWYM